MKTKINKITLLEGALELGKIDSDFAKLLDTIGLPRLRVRKPGFDSILKIICGQQISTTAARAITERLTAIEDPMTPYTAIKLGRKGLKKLGLSGQKSSYVIGIARAVENGEIKLTAIARMADEDAIDQLIKLKGIGRWSAEVYLLFVLRRPDIWPVDDLGIVKGLMKLKGLSVRPSRESLISLAEEWRPWRSVAARLLWHYVNSLDENRKKSK